MNLTQLEARGLYDPRSPDAEERLELVRFLEEQGLSIEEMADAAHRDRLPFAAADPAVVAAGSG